jgi:hypothetical protein
MTFHDLRHTFGTIAVRVFPLTDVQAMLGHSDIQTTMRYVHSVPRTDAARILAKAFEADLGATTADPVGGPFPTLGPTLAALSSQAAPTLS